MFFSYSHIIPEENDINNTRFQNASQNFGAPVPLVRTAKCSTTSTSKKRQQKQAIKESRVKKYYLQNQAKIVLREEALKNIPIDEGLRILKFHRTICCKSVPIGGSMVGVHKSIEHQKSFYSGLQTCGSVWTCPICASKIQARRTDEVAKAFKWAYSNSFKVVMVTLTYPHGIADNLKDMLGKHAVALKKFRAGNSYTLWKKRIGYQGLIRSLEITYGQSGWHPHTHELFIVDKYADSTEMKKFILNRWEKACLQAGLLKENKIDVFRQHAVDVIDNAKESDYIAKQSTVDSDKFHWGADKEIAMASTKKGKSTGRTAFQLLADSQTNTKDGELFVEHALAMRGKAQLYWSQGLKAKIGIIEKSDEELAEEETDKAVVLAWLDRKAWKIVIDNNCRSLILDVAEEFGYEGLRLWFLDYGLELDKPEPYE